jgi:hypothetical protein
MPTAHHRIPVARRRTALPLSSLPNVRPAHCIPNGSADQGTAEAIPEPPTRPRPLLQPIHRGSCAVRIGTSRPRGQDGLQERGRGHPGFLARVRKGSPAPSAESERAELCPARRNATWRNRTYRATSRRTALQSPWRRSLIPGRLCQEASGAERMGLRGWVWVMGLPLDRGRVYHPRPHPEKIIEQLDPDIPFCRA